MRLFSRIKESIALLNDISINLKEIGKNVHEMNYILSKIQEALGRIETRQNKVLESKNLRNHEFRVFSQWGEDGIIQFLLHYIELPRKIFVEFGVQNYRESNTRFLVLNDNWAGLVIDSTYENISYIKTDPIYWQHNLKALHAFITKDNINKLIYENGIEGKIGLLSIDIDGNDYWVWEAISIINPAIVITEYNFRFGQDRSVTVPYNENFIRSKAHYSMIYYGASLKALYRLAQKKGYVFVGCNSAGNNAFFVRKDLKPDCLKELTVEEGYVAGQFREARDENGQLLYLSPQEEENILSSLPLIEIEP